MFRWMINCKAVTQITSEARDRPLPLYKRIWMWMHLIMCRRCLEFNHQVQLLGRAAAAAPPPADPADKDTPCLSEEARERLRKTIQEHCK